MPRKAIVDKSVLFEALKSFAGIFTEEGYLNTSTHPVWRAVCSHPLLRKTNIKDGTIISETKCFRPKQVHDYVYQNRNNLLEDLRKEFGFFHFSNKTDCYSTVSSVSSSSENSCNDSACSNEAQNYKIAIPFEKYVDMAPSTKLYNEGHGVKRRKVLKKGAWKNIILDEFMQAYPQQCAFSFKRNKVRVDESDTGTFLFVEGYCTECKARIFITAEKEPVYPNPLQLQIRTVNTKNMPHNKKKLRDWFQKIRNGKGVVVYGSFELAKRES